MGEKVAVFGSFVVDLSGRADHLPKAGETVIGSSFIMGPGGKGSNQAVAAHRAGADVRMITKVGKDVFSSVAMDFYKSEGMDTSHIFIDENSQTGTALIMVDEQTGQNQILVNPGACMNFTDEDIDKAKDTIKNCSILLLQFEVNLEANWKAIEIARNAGTKVVLDPAPAREMPEHIYSKINIITPNEVEASILSGIDVKTPEDAARAADFFQSKGVEEVLITLGEQGAYVRSNGKDEIIKRLKVKAVDTTGAGDAFNGGLITALAEGMDIFEAAHFANVVGALSVTKLGTAKSMPTRTEIDEFRKNLRR